MRRSLTLALALILLAVVPVVAQTGSASDSVAVDLAQRQRLASVDARFAATWIADSYQVPHRVAQELLFGGYSYAETLIAMAFMGEGLSLNEVIEQRRLRGGARWQEIAEALDLDTGRLAPAIAELLWFGRNLPSRAPVLHFMPDPRPGIARELVIPAISPTVPDVEAQQRFRLNRKEIENIRRVLDDPLGVPEKDLLLPAGRGLETGDWVMAGTISYFKPFPMESILAARVGEDLPWNEVTMAFGLRPDVLTQGPLSGIYPVLSGRTPGAVLIARQRETFPEVLPLHYDLERLTPGEKRALMPLLYHTYQVSEAEQALLAERQLEIAEQGIALALARMTGLDLAVILLDRSALESWQAIVAKYAVDLTGHPELQAVMASRDGGGRP